MLPIAAVMGLMGVRVWKGDVTPDVAMLANTAVKGLLTGVAVALLEETFLRGAMFTAVARESGVEGC